MAMRRNFVPRSLLLHAASALLLVCCSNPRPSAPALPEKLFIDCYARLLIVQNEGALLGADSAAVKSRWDSVCGSFGLTGDQIQAELAVYREDPTRWKELLEKTVHRLEELQHEKPPLR